MQAGMSDPISAPIFIISIFDSCKSKKLFNIRIKAAASAEPPPKPDPKGIFFLSVNLKGGRSFNFKYFFTASRVLNIKSFLYGIFSNED